MFWARFDPTISVQEREKKLHVLYRPTTMIGFIGRKLLRKMASSGMLGGVALVRADVSEELSAFFIRVTIIDELGTTLAVTSNRPIVTAAKTSNLT
jgi:hypothetical protein